jgi:hypothetical protein
VQIEVKYKVTLEACETENVKIGFGIVETVYEAVFGETVRYVLKATKLTLARGGLIE